MVSRDHGIVKSISVRLNLFRKYSTNFILSPISAPQTETQVNNVIDMQAEKKSLKRGLKKYVQTNDWKRQFAK